MKKLFRCLLVVTMLLTVSLSSVMALGSISKPGAVVSWDAEGIDDKELYEIVWNELDVEDVERIPLSERAPMGDVNSGALSLKAHLDNVGLSSSLPKNTSSVILIQEIRDLICRNKETKELAEARNVTVTWEVPSLAEGTGEIWIYHYSDDLDYYELFKPLKVDYVNKTVTARFNELCPVGVVSIKSSKKPVNTNAVDLGMMLSIISAGAGALYILTNKKEA